MQAPLPFGNCECIIGQSEVVHADMNVAGGLERRQ